MSPSCRAQSIITVFSSDSGVELRLGTRARIRVRIRGLKSDLSVEEDKLNIGWVKDPAVVVFLFQQ